MLESHRFPASLSLSSTLGIPSIKLSPFQMTPSQSKINTSVCARQYSNATYSVGRIGYTLV